MALLLFLLACAVICDIRARRIPNGLIAIGFPAGVICSYWSLGPNAALSALAAAAVAMLFFMPAFAVRLIGAGDVKLMGMVGTFVGWSGIFPVLLYTLMAGGLLGLAAVLASGSARRLLNNLKVLLVATVLRVQGDVLPLSELASQSAVRIPYAVAISAGVVIWMLGNS